METARSVMRLLKNSNERWLWFKSGRNSWTGPMIGHVRVDRGWGNILYPRWKKRSRQHMSMALPKSPLSFGSFQVAFAPSFLSLLHLPVWPLHVTFSFGSQLRSCHSQGLWIGCSWINCPSLVSWGVRREGSNSSNRAVVPAKGDTGQDRNMES